MTEHSHPKLAVWKFASCDGCQLTLLNCEDELIPLAGEVEIAYFPEATRAVVEGPYDVSLVEGSVTTPADAERILEIRRVSRRLITIGACATSGGIQALRNFADVAEYRSIVYAHPEYVETLERSTPIAAHVTVDFELAGRSRRELRPGNRRERRRSRLDTAAPRRAGAGSRAARARAARHHHRGSRPTSRRGRSCPRAGNAR